MKKILLLLIVLFVFSAGVSAQTCSILDSVTDGQTSRYTVAGQPVIVSVSQIVSGSPGSAYFDVLANTGNIQAMINEGEKVGSVGYADVFFSGITGNMATICIVDTNSGSNPSAPNLPSQTTTVVQPSPSLPSQNRPSLPPQSNNRVVTTNSCDVDDTIDSGQTKHYTVSGNPVIISVANILHGTPGNAKFNILANTGAIQTIANEGSVVGTITANTGDIQVLFVEIPTPLSQSVRVCLKELTASTTNNAPQTIITAPNLPPQNNNIVQPNPSLPNQAIPSLPAQSGTNAVTSAQTCSIADSITDGQTSRYTVAGQPVIISASNVLANPDRANFDILSNNGQINAIAYAGEKIGSVGYADILFSQVVGNIVDICIIDTSTTASSSNTAVPPVTTAPNRPLNTNVVQPNPSLPSQQQNNNRQRSGFIQWLLSLI